MTSLFETGTGKHDEQAASVMRTSGDETEFRRRATYGVALTALLFLTPFAIVNFVHDRVLLGLGSLIVVAMLVYIAWTTYRGRYRSIAVLIYVVPVIVLFLADVFEQRGIIGALWCYPAMIAFYFMLPERLAWLANLLLMAMVVPLAWYLLEPAIAARITVTLVISSLFSATFVRVITNQRWKLERSEEKRRERMAGISHELRTPLATQSALVEAMLDGIRPVDRDQLLLLSHSLDQINGLVDDLYLLAQADVGTLVCSKERLRWDRIVDDSIVAAKHKLERRGIRIETRIERPVFIQGDPQRLRQIHNNILDNCNRYAMDGSIVTIALKCRHGVAELTVSDSGPGVSSVVLPYLFDRFYRADRSRSRAKGGAGLGLPLIKALAEAHGGGVSATHAPQGGLRIGVTIPCMPKDVSIPDHADIRQTE